LSTKIKILVDGKQVGGDHFWRSITFVVI